MSQVQKIRDYLSTLKPVADLDYIPVDYGDVAKVVNSTRDKVSSHMGAMAHAGKIELVHGEAGPQGGRPRVIGFRNMVTSNPKPKLVKTDKAAAPPVIRRLVQTPELDRIVEARQAMAEFARQFPGLVDEARAAEAIRIDESKIGTYLDEGLTLIERNRALEQSNRELRARVSELERELGYKRMRTDSQLREALSTAGVAHASD